MNTLAPLSAATAGMDLPRHRLRSISVIGGFLDDTRRPWIIKRKDRNSSGIPVGFV